MHKKRKSKKAKRDTKKAKTVPCDDKRTEEEKEKGEKFVKKIRETRNFSLLFFSLGERERVRFV